MMPTRGLCDEPALVSRTLKGDHDAFGTLVDRYAEQILNLAYRMVGDRAQADDLAQETFVAAWKALPRFRAEAKFSTWLYRIGINKCRDWLRSKGHAVQATGLEDDAIAAFDRLTDPWTPERALEQQELGARLEAAIAALPVWYREAFVLKHVEGLNYEEMNEVVGVGRDTLKMRVYKARVHLRRLLGSAHDRA